MVDLKKLFNINTIGEVFALVRNETVIRENNFRVKYGIEIKEALSNRDVAIFGGGRYGREICEDLISRKIIPVHILEGISHRVGKKVKWGGVDFEIEAVENILDRKDKVVVIISILLGVKIIDFLEANEIPYFFYDKGGYVGCLPEPRLLENKNAIAKAYDCLEDSFSKKVLKNILIARLFPEISSYIGGSMFAREVVTGPQYFDQKIFRYFDDEVFVDCGAFDGDNTIEFFKLSKELALNESSAIVIEPDPMNFELTKRRINSFGLSNVKFINAGIGKESMSETIFNCYGNKDSFSDDCKIVSIDSITETENKKTGKEHFFIKIDIEGFEREAILGAKGTLQKFKPKIAIAAYHYGWDLYELLHMIRDINPEYKFLLRHHSDTTLFETILYCY